MYVEQEIIKNILQKGKDLTEFGDNNSAYSKPEALGILSSIKNVKLLILGGDVVYFDNNNLNYAYDNWCYNPNKNKQYEDQCIASHTISEDYIRSYSSNKFEPYFTFVFENRFNLIETFLQKQIRENITD